MMSERLLNSFLMWWKSSCLVVTVLIFLMACSKEKTPPGILTKAEMAQALTELYVREARVNMQGLLPDSTRTLMEYYQVMYAEQHGIGDSTVSVSFKYYLDRPKVLSEIYDVVIDSLVLREQHLNYSRQ